MDEINHEILDFFSTDYKRGLIALVGTNDPIGLAIREAQNLITKDGAPSLWSHCFILGDMRLDLNGPANAMAKNHYIFESDLNVNLFEPQVRNGAQENWIGKWCTNKVEHAAVIDFQLSDGQTDMALASALQLVDEQVRYSISGLIGTWWAIIAGKQWLPNPLDDPRHAMYCSAFVRQCYRDAARDFMGNDKDVSNTTPEDIAQAGILANAIRLFR
jgi:hypothetical protein